MPFIYDFSRNREHPFTTGSFNFSLPQPAGPPVRPTPPLPPPPRRTSVVLPSSAYGPPLPGEARRPLLLIYDGYLQDHAERVKTFYNCATPCVVLLLPAITPSHSEMFLKVLSGIGRWPGASEEAAANRPRLLLKTCRAVIIRSAFALLSR